MSKERKILHGEEYMRRLREQKRQQRAAKKIRDKRAAEKERRRDKR